MSWFKRLRGKLRRKNESVVDAGEDESFFDRTAVQRQRDAHRHWWSTNGHRVLDEIARLEREKKRREEAAEHAQVEKMNPSPLPPS